MASISLTQAARADEDSIRAFHDFGLFGVWSPHCSLPPSMDNPSVRWRVSPEGDIVHEVTFDGRTLGVVDRVADARILDDQTIRFLVVRNGNPFLIATLRKKDERIQPLSSVGVDGHVYFSNGVDLSSGKVGLSDEHCDGALPDS